MLPLFKLAKEATRLSTPMFPLQYAYDLADEEVNQLSQDEKPYSGFAVCCRVTSGGKNYHYFAHSAQDLERLNKVAAMMQATDTDCDIAYSVHKKLKAKL